MIRLPGLIDPHVHAREPGAEHKEDWDSCTAAALAGGFTAILAMPNTRPPVTGAEGLNLALEAARRKARCDFAQFLGAAEDNLESAAGLAPRAAGLKLYLDATYGPLRVHDWATLLTHFRAWPRGRVIAVHAEELSVPLAVGLAWAHGQRLHLCHISRREEIAFIQAAKAQGAPITCEVCPHHLFLDETDLPRLGALGLMRPPLATADDRAGLWEHLDVFDCVATDHAPHTRDEKAQATPPPGVPGLETSLPLMLTAVAEGRLTLDRLVDLMHSGPRRVYRLPDLPDTWIEVDLADRWTIPAQGFQTRPDWSPFAGMAVQGRLRRVTYRGRPAFEDGQLLAREGSGRLIQSTV